MLKNIESLFFQKNLFLHVDEKVKLKFVKYNKSLQNNIGINIINYKIFNGKYVVKEKGNIILEYDRYDNTLIFVGEYLNGQRNGKGREYYKNGPKKFEGEYLNGQRHGKGKEYGENWEITFEGEYRNGKRWNAKG